MIRFRLIRWMLVLAAGGTAAVRVEAQTSYPMLMSLNPVAATIGQTSEHTLKSRYSMEGTFEVLVSGTGVTGQAILPEAKGDGKSNLQEIKIAFTVAPDALPGVRDFRLATPQGASTVGQLVIVRQPVTREQAKNDSPETAQPIDLPAAVCGTVERNEDVDFYKFHAAAGQAYTFHVRSMRLQDRIHDLQNHVDPILSIRNAQGSTVASNDNYFYGDPFIHHRFQQEGDYLLEIRDVRYDGNQYWEYCIEISDAPFVTNVFPLAVTRGQVTQLELVGYQLAEETRRILKIGDDRPCGAGDLMLDAGGGSPSPVAVVVSESPVYVEQPTENETPARAQFVSLPSQLTGRIDRETDVDCFAFAATKGESFSFEVLARRQGSSLDSFLSVRDESGKQLANNDDLRMGRRSSSDSCIESWTAPADGLYVLEIRDLHGRGGPEFVYAIKATRAEPGFRLWLDTDKTQLTPGTAGVLFVRAERLNGFDGEIQLGIAGLPHAVTATCGRVLPKSQDGCIVLEADPDAPLAAANVTVTGTATCVNAAGKPTELQVSAAPYEEIYQPGGGRGHWPVEMHTVCVGQRADIWSVALSDYEIELRPGESRQIEVTIDRAPGFDKNVTLDVTYNHLNSVYGDSLPAGVKLDLKASKTLLTGKNSQGVITLTAAKDAVPAERQQVAVMANVSINFVMKATYSSRPIFVTVAAPAAAPGK